MYDHGANQPQLGRDEFLRRGRVAIRLDELLQDVNKLLDFSYVDQDILSLRNQMRLPLSLMGLANINSSPGTPPSSASSALSEAEASPPPAKKRRLSSSSLSGVASDDEEDRPLASRMGLKTGGPRAEKSARAPASKSQRSGKKGPGIKGPGIKSKGQTAPVSLPPPVGQEQDEMNGIAVHEPIIKEEEKMDEEQLTRLTTGVTLDSGPGAAVPAVKTEKAAVGELRQGLITITAVENDKQPRSLVILTGLKTLFQKQLPKMPREYIARLVYDTNSKCLAIIKRGLKVVGGICYRPFPHRGFAEIVFFATASVDQVKGYGAMLMDHYKAHIRKTYPDMMHFLTYADNYAVGYFEKQGFSKTSLLIDYEGGTIMQCTMLPKVDYLNKPALIAAQQEAIMTKIRQMSRSHIVYPGLPQFQDVKGEVSVDYRDVPGLSRYFLSPSRHCPVRIISRSSDQYFMEKTMKELKEHSAAWAFQFPVNAEEVVDYYDVIKEPMDFKTMGEKLQANQYTSVEAFLDDAQLVFDNCRRYNPEGSTWVKNANKMDKFLKDRVSDRMKRGT
ncbi:hypothetical protein B0H17DRAFT_1157163 [Mycena rosella]|uniref:histone acetyltransferase n=1 Tax=Mycena rosella TaxID=1033263 RepID=A0AAD7DZL9_MYCRO|nr:hypothetical protein B0H17DRAFT_1157163 [Mycena rosella]